MGKRLSAAILAAILLAGALSACSTPTESEETTADTTLPDTTTVEETTTAAHYLDELPDMDYNGREIIFGISTTSESDILAAEQTGEVANDAVWDRNNKIEEKFKIKIQTSLVEKVPDDFYKKLNTIVLAGEDAYDITGHVAYDIYRSISVGIYQNWHEVDNLSLQNPWWAVDINDRATFNGRLYALSGYIGMSFMQYAQAMFFNQDIVEQYNIPSEELYQMVYDGKWTIDAFEAIVKDMYTDLNHNNTRDDEDFYGFCSAGYSSYDYWQDAFDIPITQKNADGRLTVDLYNEKRVAALETIHNFLTTNAGARNIAIQSDKTNWTWYDQYNFSQGRQAFSGGPVLGAFQLYREMKDAYGILPFPKWNEEQKDYYAQLNDRYIVWAIPKTVEDTAFVGLIAEAMARETYENVYPIFYDVVLKGKYATDENYSKMVDLVMAGTRFDVSNMFKPYMAGAPRAFRELLDKGSTDLASHYASIKGEIEQGLAEFYTFYED